MMGKSPEKESSKVTPRKKTGTPSKKKTETKPEPQVSAAENYQATVAISKEELAALGLKKNVQPEPPPASAAENYQATVAISKEELAALGLKKNVQPEPPASAAENYQATVAISKEELAALGLKKNTRQEPPESAAENYQATVAISKEELAALGCGTPGQKAPDIPQKKSEKKKVSGDQPRKSPEKIPDAEFESYTASELEKKYHTEAIKKKHGDKKYRFQRKIVAGGMGAILKVLDQDLQRVSAMKVILPKFKGNEDTLSDFITEAKITGLLEHPNIIPVHELGLMSETGLFFTMKLAQGESLNDILTEVKQGNQEYVKKYNTYHLLNIFRKVCDAVSYAHSKNIIHQDIKPHNIMVGQYGEVLMMDWGIARFVGDTADEEDAVMRDIREDIMLFSKGKDDIIKGSPTYMSPEQVIGDPRLLDKQTDIFLLGSTLYHIFTLEAPFFGKDIYEILRNAETGNLIPPEARNPSRQIPEEVCRIIAKAMGNRKEDRYKTVEDMAQEIDDLISGKWSQQEKRIFLAGEMLMREGETGDEAYLILDGKVQVVKETGGHRVVLATLKEGDIIGEMSLISQDKVARSASVEAIEATEVAVLTKNVVSQNLKKLPRYMEKIVSTLTERLRTANTNIHPYATRDCTYIVLKQLRMIFKDKANSKAKSLKISLQQLVQEISEDLGISNQKVKEVLARALEAELIENRKDSISIPDIDELARFTDFEKAK